MLHFFCWIALIASFPHCLMFIPRLHALVIWPATAACRYATLPLVVCLLFTLLLPLRLTCYLHLQRQHLLTPSFFSMSTFLSHAPNITSSLATSLLLFSCDQCQPSFPFGYIFFLFDIQQPRCRRQVAFEIFYFLNMKWLWKTFQCMDIKPMCVW